jgi:ubiquinone/menaquinone biosynthesis C-methylase UbiE
MRETLTSSIATVSVPQPAAGVSGSVLQLQCPVCRQGPCRKPFASEPMCSACGFVFSESNGIFNALPSDRESIFRQFVCEYESVRAQEGRGSYRADYYLALPFEDITGRNAWQWSIRARTFRFLQKKVLPGIEISHPKGCDILDIGAGNGWLSYRLAQRRHRPVAVDLVDNDTDGLGAAHHYFDFDAVPPFTRFKAEMDCLPFMPEQFDIVIFNASLHYSIDYTRTLRESLRCLRRDGHLIIADSPFYWREESGQKMLQEKRATFERQFGFRSDSVQSREYITPEMLKDLTDHLNLKWSTYKPWYGMGWALRPAKARLMLRREPSKFYLLHAQREN